MLVDEYQDTNRAQYRWLQLLTEEHRNLCVVGDDDQSVYAFRGADIQNILGFERGLSGRHRRQARAELSLDADDPHRGQRRSSRNNRRRKDKSLWSDLGDGDQVHVRELEDEHAEARFVVSEIERLVDEGASRDEVAVFYRTNAQTRVLEDMLVRYGVGYQVIGGTRFYERAEIKDALAYLTLLVNPADTVAFARVVNSPRRGIGETSQGRLVGYANTIGEPVWDVAAEPESVPGLAPAAIKAVDRFMSVMERLRERAEGGAGVGDLLPRRSRRPATWRRSRPSARSRRRGGSRTSRSSSASRASTTPPPRSGSVEEFLQQVALFSEQDNLRDDEGIVTLMTLHNAKGLEYEIVFIIGLEDGVFPHSRSIEAGTSRRSAGSATSASPGPGASLPPHARTRMLFGARDWNMPSRFIDEIPSSSPTRPGALTGPRRRPHRAEAPRRRAARRLRAAAALRLGEDVVHAGFGEGVVIGLEPGGLVVVRFAGDGSERKLMADYAPLKE